MDLIATEAEFFGSRRVRRGSKLSKCIMYNSNNTELQTLMGIEETTIG